MDNRYSRNSDVPDTDVFFDDDFAPASPAAKPAPRPAFFDRDDDGF